MSVPVLSQPTSVVKSPAALKLESHIVYAALVLLVCLGFCFYGLNVGDLYRNEGLRAILAQEMLRTGNWLVPMLYGEPLLTKPPGMYIAIALCSWPFGQVTEVTARLPSALAASTVILLVFWTFLRYAGPRPALLAALLVPMTPFWLDKAITAEIDMLQVAWVTAAILCFLRGIDDEFTAGAEPRRSESDLDPQLTVPTVRFGWLLASMLCLAGGVLTKWTAPVFVYGAIVPLLWWRGRLRLLFGWQHLIAAAIGATLVCAWIGAVVAQTGWDLFWETVSREALQHLAPGQSPKPYLWSEVALHPLAILAATLPWSPLALWTLRPIFMRALSRQTRFFCQALHCWTWPAMLFWTFATEHSVRHSAPLFPGLLGLSALALWQWIDSKRAMEAGERLADTRRLRRFLVTALAVWLVIKVVYVEVVIPGRLAKRQTSAKAAVLAALVPVDAILYIFRLKDEGILFYYGRDVIRVYEPSELPMAQTSYCLLTDEEWQRWNGPAVSVVEYLHDAQGAAIVLVRTG